MSLYYVSWDSRTGRTTEIGIRVEGSGHEISVRKKGNVRRVRFRDPARPAGIGRRARRDVTIEIIDHEDLNLAVHLSAPSGSRLVCPK